MAATKIWADWACTPWSLWSVGLGGGEVKNVHGQQLHK